MQPIAARSRTNWRSLVFTALATAILPLSAAAGEQGPCEPIGQPDASNKSRKKAETDTVSAVISAVVSDAVLDERGFLVHTVSSPYQSGATKINVLLPDQRESNRRYPVAFVLPVEAADGTRWGDALSEVKRADLHNRFGVVCVYPTFSQLPWYCDHASDPKIRQESYFLNVVVPAVQSAYPVQRSAAGRWLVGFSKSGWGAWCLLLRHPDKFSKAVAWDAPLMMNGPGKYGSGPIFGDAANFGQYYVKRLLEKRGKQLGPAERLGLFGYDRFRTQHVQTHSLLERLRIKHAYRDGPQRRHHWNSGWLPEAFAWLATGAVSDRPPAGRER